MKKKCANFGRYLMHTNTAWYSLQHIPFSSLINEKKKELADRYKNKFLRLSHNDPKPLDDNINRNGMIVWHEWINWLYKNTSGINN